MNISPVVLFTYNRPYHTQKTLEALSNNSLADQSTLYVFCDGPKKEMSTSDFRNHQLVKKIIRAKYPFKEVTIFERENNVGLANNIIEGVTYVINKFGKVIVLEDDIVTSPGFLTFMNEALRIYGEEDKVMHISGFMYPIKYNFLLPKNFFLYSMNCWGWATWKRSWDNAVFDFNELKTQLLKIDLKNFDNVNYNAWDQIEKNISGELKTWAVAWYSSIYLNNGLCLFPNKSLVKNIGYDNTGTHCGTNEIYQNQKTAKKIRIINPTLEVYSNIEGIILYFRSIKYSGLKLLKARIRLIRDYFISFILKIKAEFGKH